MASYTPNVDDLSEPKDSRGVGSAAAEFRSIKRRLAEAWTRIGTLTSSFTSLSTEVNARMDEVESDVAGITNDLIGQIAPFVRPGFVDLESWLYCDGRYIGPDCSTLAVPHTSAQLFGDDYKELFRWIWTMLAYSRAQWYAASPDGLGNITTSPISIAFWNGLVWQTNIEMPDPGTVADWEAAWNDTGGKYAVFIPNLCGRSVRGSNPMNGLTALPDEGNPIESLNAGPDYGRLIGTYQHASLLTGDRDRNTVNNIGNVQTLREKLGWDKLAADITVERDIDGLATTFNGTGAPYPPLRRSEDHPETEATLRLSIPQVSSTADVGSPSSNYVENSGKIPYHVGSARVDNYSLPMYIRYK